MSKMYILFLACCITFLSVNAQTDSISLIKCLEATRNNAAIKVQLNSVSEIAGLKTANASVTNLPSLSAYGKATYQSQTMSITLPNAGALEIDPFQYNFGLEANQKLFDGGIASKSKDIEAANLAAETSRIETDLYQLNNLTVQHFFSNLLFTRNLEVIQLKETIVRQKVAELQSAYDNGAIPRYELDKLKTELIVIQQQIMEIDKLRLQSLSNLKVLTGLKIDSATCLYVPDSIRYLASSERPENIYFNAENERLQSMISLKSRQNLPKIYAFGQLGYSYPGLNFFENKSDYYYILGAKLSWNIYDWNQVNRDKRVIVKQQEIVSSRKSDFEQKTSQLIDREIIEQEKLEELIALDSTIIDQRISISAASASALQNGVITTATYLEDLNNEIKSRIDLQTHKIQLLNSIVRLQLLKGVDINFENRN
jgi:outer membrane protein TolC